MKDASEIAKGKIIEAAKELSVDVVPGYIMTNAALTLAEKKIRFLSVVAEQYSLLNATDATTLIRDYMSEYSAYRSKPDEVEDEDYTPMTPEGAVFLGVFTENPDKGIIGALKQMFEGTGLLSKAKVRTGNTHTHSEFLRFMKKAINNKLDRKSRGENAGLSKSGLDSGDFSHAENAMSHQRGRLFSNWFSGSPFYYSEKGHFQKLRNQFEKTKETGLIYQKPLKPNRRSAVGYHEIGKKPKWSPFRRAK